MKWKARGIVGQELWLFLGSGIDKRERWVALEEILVVVPPEAVIPSVELLLFVGRHGIKTPVEGARDRDAQVLREQVQDELIGWRNDGTAS